MNKKLLITLPCSIRQLKAKLDNFDGCDVVVCNYDGDGDSLYVIPVEEEEIKIETVQKNPDPVERMRKFVRDLEAAHKATANSKLVFK